MRFYRDQIQLSASDLVKHLACRHLTFLDLGAARGELQRPIWSDPTVVALEQRGFWHEADYINHLKAQGLPVVKASERLDDPDALQKTIALMKQGVNVIAQAELQEDDGAVAPMYCCESKMPSDLGNWSYRSYRYKIGARNRGGTILQLCLYSELVGKIQGFIPESMYVVTPENEFQKETFRLHDYLAYYRYVKRRLEKEVDEEQDAGSRMQDRSGGGRRRWVAPTQQTLDWERSIAQTEERPVIGPTANSYPEPVEHCEICEWFVPCNDRRRKDDHLSFVAGISKLQMVELRKWNITSLADLAAMPLPLKQRPDRGSAETYEKIREQARIQLEYRNTKTPIYELLALEPERGFARLPAPSAGDIFLDFESDPFVDDGGLEYLLGYVTLEEAAQPLYIGLWALHRAEERRAFESFIDMVTERLRRYPDLHIYHFSHYEPTALKRLMGRYASRQDEMDRMLRAGMFVDLYGITKQSLRASVEKYSLKDLEMFFDFHRKVDLKDANTSRRFVECALELNDMYGIPPEMRKTVEEYNRDDCISTLKLRDWLEIIRSQQIGQGKEIPRPSPESGEPSGAVDERRKQVLQLMEKLLQDIPEDPADQNPQQNAKWLIAQVLELHRREEKVLWWEYFRLKDLSDEELLDQRYAISGLQFVESVGNTKKCRIDRYSFPPQDLEVRVGDALETSTGPFGEVELIDIAHGIVDVRKRTAMTDVHPGSVFVHKIIRAESQKDSLLRIGRWIAENGVDGEGMFRAGRDLLLRKPPRLKGGGPLLESPLKIVLELDRSVLPMQGPPGAGKTFTGAHMICALLRARRKVGITAVSHKVIRKLSEEVLNVVDKEGLAVQGIQKVSELSDNPHSNLYETKDNEDVLSALKSGKAQFGAGTGWMWARPEYAESLDVLFVDEAGQMSLADVLAVSQSAKSVVLLGDPQQLEQPLQGTHPPGVAVSALQHILGEQKTIPSGLGYFLGETWRLSPEICKFTSELFYDNRLKPHDGCEKQAITGSRFAGSGLWYVPVNHNGNQSSSIEEADAVEAIVRELLDGDCYWTDLSAEKRRIQLDDILMVAPYNAHVFELAMRIPKGRIGTVDKFQGQEAPVVIYSMATSSPEDAPHGMEFLYSLNRFNVATSRARCACILVASPGLFEPDCKSPHQMKLANVLCRYRELAK